MTSTHSQNSVNAAARQRLAGPTPDYPPLIDHGETVFEWVFKHRPSGRAVVMELKPSPRRKNSWTVLVDGKVWKNQIGFYRLVIDTTQSLLRLARRDEP